MIIATIDIFLHIIFYGKRDDYFFTEVNVLEMLQLEVLTPYSDAERGTSHIALMEWIKNVN